MIAVNQLHDPAVHGIVTNCRDITDRVDADAQFPPARNASRRSLRARSDVISVIDADGKLRYSSSVTTHVLGYPEGAGYGEHILDVVASGGSPRVSSCSFTCAKCAGCSGRSRCGCSACRQLVDVRGDPRQQPARRPSLQGIVVTIREHHRTQAGRGPVAR